MLIADHVQDVMTAVIDEEILNLVVNNYEKIGLLKVMNDCIDARIKEIEEEGEREELMKMEFDRIYYDIASANIMAVSDGGVHHIIPATLAHLVILKHKGKLAQKIDYLDAMLDEVT